MPLPLTVSCSNKIQIGFTFWYRLTWVVPDKGPLNGCVCVCVNVDMKAQKARKISCKNSQPLEKFFQKTSGCSNSWLTLTHESAAFPETGPRSVQLILGSHDTSVYPTHTDHAAWDIGSTRPQCCDAAGWLVGWQGCLWTWAWRVNMTPVATTVADCRGPFSRCRRSSVTSYSCESRRIRSVRSALHVAWSDATESRSRC